MNDYAVKNLSRPDMTSAAFVAALRAAHSPVSDAEAEAVYAYAAARKVSPAFILGVFERESSFGTKGWATKTRSWGNTRPPSFARPGIGSYNQDTGAFHAPGSKPPSGRYLTAYANWADGGVATIARLLDKPDYAGKDTVRGIVPVWAPASENDVAAYVTAVLAAIARYVAGAKGVTKMAPKVAICAGHANTDGGNPFERETTGRLTPAIARACAALGMDVRVVQEGDPSRDFPGGIWDVARRVVQWSEAGWTPDIFLETHTQGLGNAAVRGVFGIYPDWGGDVDTDARDRLIPDAMRRISAATGIPVWTDGVMSERATGVGLSGSRLGILNKTAPLAATTTRLLIEYGAHSNPLDAAIHRTDKFYEGAARATAEAFAVFLGIPTRPVTVFTGPQAPATTDERAALLAWADTIPLIARGTLTREGVADFSAWGGGTSERIARYERLVAHRLAGGNYVLMLDLYDQLRAENKIIFY